MWKSQKRIKKIIKNLDELTCEQEISFKKNLKVLHLNKLE